jgi:predicted Zn finger-like uncharacterized protein
MVVECPECGVKFSLDESRIPGAVAKVRCSRCRHVFRINREGQIVSPEWGPPLEESPEPLPPAEEGREAIPASGAWEAAESAPAPEKEAAAEAVASPPPEAAPPESASVTQKLRLWWWLPALALVIVAALGWWFLQGKSAIGPFKPLTDVIDRLKAQEPPPEPPTPDSAGQKKDDSAPAAAVVTPPSPPVPAPDLREVPVDWAQAHYQGLVNDQAGQLLIIQGEVLNKGNNPRGPIRLKAVLTDSRHQPLREEVVYAGTTLTDAELKTLDPEEIKGWLHKPGGRSQEQVLKPGHKQPFTVVFFGAPGKLVESQSGFQIMVVEGSEAAARP